MTTLAIDPDQVQVLRHALGLHRAPVPYRNHFVADPGSRDFHTCRALVERGFMVTRYLEGPDRPLRTFAVMQAGIEAVTQ